MSLIKSRNVDAFYFDDCRKDGNHDDEDADSLLGVVVVVVVVEDDWPGEQGFLAPLFQLGHRFSSATPAMAQETCIPHPAKKKGRKVQKLSAHNIAIVYHYHETMSHVNMDSMSSYHPRLSFRNFGTWLDNTFRIWDWRDQRLLWSVAALTLIVTSVTIKTVAALWFLWNVVRVDQLGTHCHFSETDDPLIIRRPTCCCLPPLGPYFDDGNRPFVEIFRRFVTADRDST